MKTPTWSIVDVRTGKVVEKDLFLEEAKRNSSKNFKIRAQEPVAYTTKLNAPFVGREKLLKSLKK
jgi:hypothetical protein